MQPSTGMSTVMLNEELVTGDGVGFGVGEGVGLGVGDGVGARVGAGGGVISGDVAPSSQVPPHVDSQ